MTIYGFWDTVNENHPLQKYRVSFKDYANSYYKDHGRFLTVGVDLFQWMFEHVTVGDSPKSNLPEDDASIHVVVAGIATKLKYLKALCVNYVVVFDGLMKLEKQGRNNKGQFNKGRTFEEQYALDLKVIENGGHILRLRLITKICEMLESWNISYIHAPGDGEIELARLNQANIIDAIISNDADGFAYGAKIILRNFSKNLDDKPSTVNGQKDLKDFYVTPVDYHILNEMNLDSDKVMFIACTNGDDYSNGVKGMGIKRAWSLATNTFGDFDVVQKFKEIYVSKVEGDYLQGKFPYNYETRIKLLAEYSENLKAHITKNVRQYFKRSITTKSIELPTDYILATHYYPHFSPQLFRFNPFDTNMNNISGNLTTKLKLPILPQPLSIKINGNTYYMRRGNALKKSLHWTQFINYQANEEEKVPDNSLDWFTKVKYATLIKWVRHPRASREGMEYLAEFLGQCTLWNAIVCYKKLELQPGDIFIKGQKITQTEGEHGNYDQRLFQVKYKPRQIYKKLLSLPYKLTDDNLNEIEEKPVHIWMPSYMFDLEDNGRSIMRDFIDEKLSKPNTPKSTPKRSRKKNTPTQATTLDFLSKSPKSSFRLLENKPLLLKMSDATVNNNKRSPEFDDIFNGSPKKKKKTDDKGDISMSDAGTKEKTAMFENANSGANDVSDISDYSVESFDAIHGTVKTEENTEAKRNSFLESSDVIDLTSDDDESASTKDHNENRFRNLLAPRTEHKRNKLTLSRGISLLDEQTRLPEVPKNPESRLANQSKLLDNVNEEYSFSELSDCNIDDVFAHKLKTEIPGTSQIFNNSDREDTLSTVDMDELDRNRVTGQPTMINLIQDDDTFSSDNMSDVVNNILTVSAVNLKTATEIINLLDTDDDNNTIMGLQETPKLNRIYDLSKPSPFKKLKIENVPLLLKSESLLTDVKTEVKNEIELKTELKTEMTTEMKPEKERIDIKTGMIKLFVDDPVSGILDAHNTYLAESTYDEVLMYLKRKNEESDYDSEEVYE